MSFNMQKRIVHRFIQPIAAYEKGGKYHYQVIPNGVQAYAQYDIETDFHKAGLFYVIGDSEHTYLEIRDGKGKSDLNKEYLASTQSALDNAGITDVPNNDIIYARKNKQWVEIEMETLLKLTDVEVNTTDWLYYTGSDIYTNEYRIYNTNITKEMLPSVIFNEAEAISGIYSPVCNAEDGYIAIYAKEIPENNFIIPVILLQ